MLHSLLKKVITPRLPAEVGKLVANGIPRKAA
jgi:hypothetical protein